MGIAQIRAGLGEAAGALTTGGGEGIDVGGWS